MKIFQRTKYVFTSKDHCNVHQLLIATSLQLLLPVIPNKNFGAKIFNRQKTNSTKIKCLLFRPKPQKLPVIQYQEGWIPLIGLTLPHFCACPKPGPGIPISYVVVHIFVPLPSQDQEYPYHMSWSTFFICLMN